MPESDLFPIVLPDLSKLYDETTAGIGQSTVIFGAGQLGRLIAQRVKTFGITTVAFTDNNTNLWGSEINGIPVMSPDDALRRHGESVPFLIAIATIGLHAFSNELKTRGARMVVPFHQLAWKYPDAFLPYYFLDTQAHWLQNRACVKATYQLLHDDLSRLEFARQSLWRCTGEDTLLTGHTEGVQYLREELFRLPPNPVFIDCGAYDGDSTHDWISFTKASFSHVYAFEPDPENYLLLKRNIADLGEELASRITAFPYATGSCAGTARFESGRGISSVVSNEGENEIQVVTLDEIFADKPVSMIKMDIESAEFDTLVGARAIIQRDRPILAICIYHSQQDLWRIPLLVASITSRYRFHIRRHTATWFETVLYAVPEELAVD